MSAKIVNVKVFDKARNASIVSCNYLLKLPKALCMNVSAYETTKHSFTSTDNFNKNLSRFEPTNSPSPVQYHNYLALPNCLAQNNKL